MLVWVFWPTAKTIRLKHQKKKISLIIPVRNEEKGIQNLLNDLEAQSLAKTDFEVLIVNDNSTDSTQDIVLSHINKSKINFKLIQLLEAQIGFSPKKRAIGKAIGLSEGEIIVTTDGDCRPASQWLETIQAYFANYDCVFLSAPVCLSSPKPEKFFTRIWYKFQEIEFASLIVSGATSIKMGKPNMCSGANLAYLKSAFHEVGAYEGNDHIASGDDEFLMHKMKEHFPNGVHYLKNETSLVQTSPIPDLASFYNQRKRWASKWQHYSAISPKILALFIFSCNALFLFALFSVDVNWILLKLIPEFFFLSSVLLFFKKSKLIPLIPLLQIIYPMYVVFFGLLSLKKNKYVWKERALS
ncbi:MAG: cellulose synthase/poly-beta-1,6-N-acetylglucosamine synthase-like glycosyltransferase [Arcticibacterium sp.]|jgi:cellulose synthase/poly-beta-1,6-N-acetylglucosamine synthase-like glycosyltransferase